jgi:hypothetical protein
MADLVSYRWRRLVHTEGAKVPLVRLRPVEALPRPEEITIDDLGVVCWMAVLP